MEVSESDPLPIGVNWLDLVATPHLTGCWEFGRQNGEPWVQVEMAIGVIVYVWIRKWPKKVPGIHNRGDLIRFLRYMGVELKEGIELCRN